jgi:hypothetical protein
MKRRSPQQAAPLAASFHPTARKVRGYRIRIWRGPRHPQPAYTTPTMWREALPLEEWQRVTSDPATLSAHLIRSGRKMKAYQFERSPMIETEPQHAWASPDDERTAFNSYELSLGIIA